MARRPGQAPAAGVDLALRLVLVALLLRPVGGEELRGLFLAGAAAGLLLPPLLRHPALWWTLCALATVRVLRDWPLADNHAYLLAYWCLAAALSLGAPAPAETLAGNGRRLLGLVFAFATLWKLVLSPDFLSGDFMRFTWLTDPRFEDAARILGRLDANALDANRALLAGAPGAPAALVEPTPFRWLTGLATTWTAVLEPALALAFLWPGARGPARWRDPLLLLFCATTYAFAPVAGFAWLLLSMGVAQSETRLGPGGSVRSGGSTGSRGAGLRWVYLAVFALVLVYREVPWISAIEAWP